MALLVERNAFLAERRALVILYHTRPHIARFIVPFRLCVDCVLDGTYGPLFEDLKLYVTYMSLIFEDTSAQE